MKRFLSATAWSLLIALALIAFSFRALHAQNPPPTVAPIVFPAWPDVFTPGTAYSNAATNWVLQTQGNVNALAQQANQNVAAIQDLQARVAALEAKLNPPAPPPTPAGLYALSVSTLADRSSATNQNGSTVRGSVFIFTSSATNVQSSSPAGIGTAGVCYWIDNSSGSGTPAHCEASVPYDFQGGVATAAAPWSSSSIPNGTHTLTQKVSLASGATEVDTANFTVAN